MWAKRQQYCRPTARSRSGRSDHTRGKSISWVNGPSLSGKTVKGLRTSQYRFFTLLPAKTKMVRFSARDGMPVDEVLEILNDRLS